MNFEIGSRADSIVVEWIAEKFGDRSLRLPPIEQYFMNLEY